MPSQRIRPYEDAGVEDDPSVPARGWSVRGALPYARIGHAATLDTDQDRMLVFGGHANDVWALALTGDSSGRWSQIVASNPPPIAGYPITTDQLVYPDSAVYVPERHSMVVVLNPRGSFAGGAPNGNVWELSLADKPRWRQLAGIDRDEGRLTGIATYDTLSKRLLVLATEGSRDGLWSLGLEAGSEPVWSRIADAPERSEDRAALCFDAERNRVLLTGDLYYSDSAPIYALQLDGASEWREIDTGTRATAGFGHAFAIDAQHDALVIVGGSDQLKQVATYSLADGGWSSQDAPRGFDSATVIADAERERLIVFGGSERHGGLATHGTWSYTPATRSWERLHAASGEAVPSLAYETLVYDPERDAVIAFGESSFLYELGNDDRGPDAWRPLEAGALSAVAVGGAIYDPIARAVVTYVSEPFDPQRLFRLRSDPDATWEAFEIDGGRTLGTFGQAMVYDEANERAIVVAGKISDGSYEDAFALSLRGALEWKPLLPTPDEHVGVAAGPAIYDPIGRRVVLVQDDGLLAVLPLEGEAQWSLIETSGDYPRTSRGVALYEPEQHRLIAVSADAEDPLGGTPVHALDLDTLTWRRYCPRTIAPAAGWVGTDFRNAALVPDGIFIVFANATYRFDLSAPYCD